LYDLSKDIGETRDIAAKHPDLVAKATRIMDKAHINDPAWVVQGQADVRDGRTVTRQASGEEKDRTIPAK
jgi:hypothetical protein